MEAICQEIGISWQHVCESSVPERYQLICDKQWLQILEQKRKITAFPSYPNLDRRAHPAGPLEHPWARILVQTYRKQPHLKVFPLQYHPAEAVGQSADEDDYEFGTTMPLTYSQALNSVTNTNFRNLWEAAYKRYHAAHVKFCKPSIGRAATLTGSTSHNLLPYDAVLKELIQRIFRCPIIHCQLDKLGEGVDGGVIDVRNYDVHTNECHANVLPALIAIETSTHISVFFYPPAIVTSLYDCITYSPSILSKSYNKPLFLIYQMFQLSKSLQSLGLLMGDVSLHDILVRDNLWLQVLPRLEANILQHSFEEAVTQSPSEAALGAEADFGTNIEMSETKYLQSAADDEDACATSTKFDLKFAYDLSQLSLRDYCEMWCNGQLSNYDYLIVLNNASGRSLTNPAYHHIMPWVTDFTARNGANWRDLSKSKYRLNKGDIHLDLMFSNAGHNNLHIGSGPAHQVPHHVSDFLSEITYFVYMARRTPQHILREHVRPIWVPAEYPVSIQRLQEWTPDECIPEFYSDPMIFKSIHEDLADLELPTWATCPEDFICKHREALESQYVSERLHHWIDLNFGYKLSGKAAIKSKNVCLSMVDQHKNLCQRGIVQLFTQPHPPKRFPTSWFNKTAPRLNQFLVGSSDQRPTSKSRYNLGAKEGKRLAKSTENLHISDDIEPEDTPMSSNTSTHSAVGPSPRLALRAVASSGEELVGSSNFYRSTNFIELPKDYNPCALLHSLETMQGFFARTFPKQKATRDALEKMIGTDLLFDEHSEEHSFTNQLFAEATAAEPYPRARTKNMLAPNVQQQQKRLLRHMLSERGERELQVLGCLIVELFAMQRLRPLLMNGSSASFEERLQACRTIAGLYQQDIPKCLRYVATLLLQPPPAAALITEKGLPPPTASQLLEPIFSNLLIPFPNTYYPTYALIRSLHSFDFDSTLLELNTHFHCNGTDCAKYAELDRKRVLFERKIAECKVMSCCAHIRRLLEPVAYEQFPSVELLLPHIIDLLTAEQTSILTAWNLFDPVAQALGITRTQKHLLQPIMKLYDVESFERGMTSVRSRANMEGAGNPSGQLRFSTSSSFKSRKSVKLYHHSFLLRLIVRFGLRCFLQHFIAPLIEAVGGYKEPEDGNGLHYHSSLGRRTSKNLKYATAAAGDDEECSLTLISPECVDTELEDVTLSMDGAAPDQKAEIEGVFTFDDDANSDRISSSGAGENKSLDSFEMRPTTAEEAKEEDQHVETTPEKLAISEIIFGSKISNNSLDDTDKVSSSSQNASDSPPTASGPRSPTIDIPTAVLKRSYQLNTIDCDIGSRKSVDSFEIIQNAAEEEQKQLRDKQQQQEQEQQEHRAKGRKNDTNLRETEADRDACDSLQASVISKMSEAKSLQNNRISEMSAESLVWLSHRLGPVLTSRHITRNLLKMLTLCYVGQENLLPETNSSEEIHNLNYFTVVDARVVGDRSAVRVLECLLSIAALYGEQVILLQYFPHISELIALGTKRITGSLEGAIISTLQLLKYIVPCLTDATIMEHLKDLFLDSVLLPVLRFLGSTRLLMPSGYLGRSVLARKLLDATYSLCVRIGPDMSREHLCFTVLRPFFLIFDKAFGESTHFGVELDALSVTPPPSVDCENSRQRALEEIRDVFSPALAHSAYLVFLRFLGEAIMQRTLLNLEFILTLCHEFEQPDYKGPEVLNRAASNAVDCPTRESLGVSPADINVANSFGTQVVGNRIEVAPLSSSSLSSSTNQKEQHIKQEVDSMEVLDMVAYKFEHLPTTRHLRGNWLAYWRHEITRPDKDAMLNLKQIKLQSFVGHTNSVRAILALDNENSFISASKDKMVKLWSLRSEGDGSKTSSCQFTYTAHKKSIHSLAFLEAMRFVVSCDSGVHIWDPFIGRPLGVLDSPKHNPVAVVKCLPSPSPLIMAGTAESSVKIIDSRCMQYVNEWRVSANSQNSATVRCLTVAPSGNWLAVGLSSGSIVMLDTRTGMLLNSWRPMECDLLQLAAPNDQQLVSSALDHSLAVWHAQDGILHYQLMPPAEPAHFLQTIGSELVFATTGNRIGIYSDLSNSHASHSITKLRSETFRGVLTSLAVLPLNRTFLTGNESGIISLLC